MTGNLETLEPGFGTSSFADFTAAGPQAAATSTVGGRTALRSQFRPPRCRERERLEGAES
jgi:hypothetical protein